MQRPGSIFRRGSDAKPASTRAEDEGLTERVFPAGELRQVEIAAEGELKKDGPAAIRRGTARGSLEIHVLFRLAGERASRTPPAKIG